MAQNRKDLSANEIRRLLGKLDAELAGRGHRVTVYVVGGANMALAVDGSRSTTDIDAVVKTGYRYLIDAAKAVAATEAGLGEDWINTEFTGGDNPQGGLFWRWFDNRDTDVPLSFFEGQALAVEGASAPMMLALKTLANRDQDLADTFTLMRRTEIRTPLEIGRNLARFTGPRIFSVQGSDAVYPRVDPRFAHIFDNAPDDLQVPGYGSTPTRAERKASRKAEQQSAKLARNADRQAPAERCGLVKVSYRGNQEVSRTQPCTRTKGHLPPHRFGGNAR